MLGAPTGNGGNPASKGGPGSNLMGGGSSGAATPSTGGPPQPPWRLPGTDGVSSTGGGILGSSMSLGNRGGGGSGVPITPEELQRQLEYLRQRELELEEITRRLVPAGSPLTHPGSGPNAGLSAGSSTNNSSIAGAGSNTFRVNNLHTNSFSMTGAQDPRSASQPPPSSQPQQQQQRQPSPAFGDNRGVGSGLGGVSLAEMDSNAAFAMPMNSGPAAGGGNPAGGHKHNKGNPAGGLPPGFSLPFGTAGANFSTVANPSSAGPQAGTPPMLPFGNALSSLQQPWPPSQPRSQHPTPSQSSVTPPSFPQGIPFGGNPSNNGGHNTNNNHKNNNNNNSNSGPFGAAGAGTGGRDGGADASRFMSLKRGGGGSANLSSGGPANSCGGAGGANALGLGGPHPALAVTAPGGPFSQGGNFSPPPTSQASRQSANAASQSSQRPFMGSGGGNMNTGRTGNNNSNSNSGFFAGLPVPSSMQQQQQRGGEGGANRFGGGASNAQPSLTRASPSAAGAPASVLAQGSDKGSGTAATLPNTAAAGAAGANSGHPMSLADFAALARPDPNGPEMRALMEQYSLVIKHEQEIRAKIEMRLRETGGSLPLASPPAAGNNAATTGSLSPPGQGTHTGGNPLPNSGNSAEGHVAGRQQFGVNNLSGSGGGGGTGASGFGGAAMAAPLNNGGGTRTEPSVRPRPALPRSQQQQLAASGGMPTPGGFDGANPRNMGGNGAGGGNLFGMGSPIPLPSSLAGGNTSSTHNNNNLSGGSAQRGGLALPLPSSLQGAQTSTGNGKPWGAGGPSKSGSAFPQTSRQGVPSGAPLTEASPPPPPPPRSREGVTAAPSWQQPPRDPPGLSGPQVPSAPARNRLGSDSSATPSRAEEAQPVPASAAASNVSPSSVSASPPSGSLDKGKNATAAQEKSDSATGSAAPEASAPSATTKSLYSVPSILSPLFGAKSDTAGTTNAWRTGGGGRQLFKTQKEGGEETGKAAASPSSPSQGGANASQGTGNASVEENDGSTSPGRSLTGGAIPPSRHQQQQQQCGEVQDPFPPLTAVAATGAGAEKESSMGGANTITALAHLLQQSSATAAANATLDEEEILTPLQRMQRSIQQRRQAEGASGPARPADPSGVAPSAPSQPHQDSASLQGVSAQSASGVPLPMPRGLAAAAAAVPTAAPRSASRTDPTLAGILDFQRRIREQNQGGQSASPASVPNMPLAVHRHLSGGTPMSGDLSLPMQQQQPGRSALGLGSNANLGGGSGGNAPPFLQSGATGPRQGEPHIPLPASVRNQKQQQQHQQQQRSVQPPQPRHFQNPQGVPQGVNSTANSLFVPAHAQRQPPPPQRQQSAAPRPTASMAEHLQPDEGAVKLFKDLYARQSDEETVAEHLRKQSKTAKGTVGTLDIEACLSIIDANDVTFVVTDTGTGKSTLIPTALIGRAKKSSSTESGDAATTTASSSEKETAPGVMVVNCQPRRTSAINLAQRVAVLLGEERPGTTVGYSVRGERTGEIGETPLMYVTNYTLFLHILWRRPEDIPFTHIILDEFHERTSEVEMMLPMLKMVLLKYPKKFKLILCSATPGVSEWKSFFSGFSLGVYNQANEMFPVYSYFLEDTCRLIGSRCVPWEPKPNNVVESLQLQNIMLLVKQVLTFLGNIAAPSHSILVFLPGRTNVEHMADWIRSAMGEQLDPIPWYRDIDLGYIQSALQREAITKKKVYLATDIAEVSLTLPDVVFVIDSGMSKRPQISASDPASIAFPPLQLLWESAMNTQQRRGRIGRVQQGFYFCLLPHAQHEKLSEGNSRISNSVVHELVLHTLQLTPNPFASFMLCRERPRLISIFHSLTTLRDTGLLLRSRETFAEAERLRYKNKDTQDVVASSEWNHLITDAVGVTDFAAFLKDSQDIVVTRATRGAATAAAEEERGPGATHGEPASHTVIRLPRSLVDERGRTEIPLEDLADYNYLVTMKGMFVSHLPIAIEAATNVFYGLQFGIPALAIIAAAVEATKSPFYVPYDIVGKLEKKTSSVQVSREMMKYHGELQSDIVAGVGAVLSYMEMQLTGLSEAAQEEWCTTRCLSRSRLMDILNLIQQIREQTRAMIAFPDVVDVDRLKQQYDAGGELLAFLSVASHMQWGMYVANDMKQAQRQGFNGSGIFFHMRCIQDTLVPTVCPWTSGSVCVPLSLQTTYNKLRATFATQVDPQIFNLAVLVFSFRVKFMQTTTHAVAAERQAARRARAHRHTNAAHEPPAEEKDTPDEEVYIYETRYMNILQTFQCDALTGRQIQLLRCFACARLCILQNAIEGRVDPADNAAMSELLQSTPTDFGLPSRIVERPEVLASLLQSALSNILSRIKAGVARGTGPQPGDGVGEGQRYGYCIVVPPVRIHGENAGESMLVHASNGIFTAAGETGATRHSPRQAPATTTTTTNATEEGPAAERVPPTHPPTASDAADAHEDDDDSLMNMDVVTDDPSTSHPSEQASERAQSDDDNDHDASGYHSDSSDSINHAIQFNFDA